MHFNPRPPRGGRRQLLQSPAHHGTISIHALREEGDLAVLALLCTGGDISIHALREEGDPRRAPRPRNLFYFNPRPPRGGRPSGRRLRRPAAFISIHALREEGDLLGYIQALKELPISIHALREEGDLPDQYVHGILPISIHALREEGDLLSISMSNAPFYFNPRPPRGGRRLEKSCR